MFPEQSSILKALIWKSWPNFLKNQILIRFYPPEKLSDGGFLLVSRHKKRTNSLCPANFMLAQTKWQLIEDWLSGNEMNHLLRHNVHQTKADIFIPGGGRPRTLNDYNFKD